MVSKNISTVHAVLDIVSSTIININKNCFNGLTLLYDILLAKLEHYGFPGPAQSLMQSYLNHQQFVCISGTNSTIKAIPYGIAQGSTLSPLLFLLYINDLHHAITSTYTKIDSRRYLPYKYRISSHVILSCIYKLTQEKQPQNSDFTKICIIQPYKTLHDVCTLAQQKVVQNNK